MKRFNREVVRRDCLVCVGIDCEPVISDPLPSLFIGFVVSISCTGDVSVSSTSTKPTIRTNRIGYVSKQRLVRITWFFVPSIFTQYKLL